MSVKYKIVYLNMKLYFIEYAKQIRDSVEVY